MYRRKYHSTSEMRHLVNRNAIHVLSQNHRIRDKMLHACTSRGATCTAKQGRIVQTQNFIFGRFSNFFFFIQMGPGPTHPLPNYFWIFGIFLTLHSPLQYVHISLATRKQVHGICLYNTRLHIFILYLYISSNAMCL